MARQGRNDDWGFPRWRPYGSSREAAQVRMCDRAGCDDAGKCPAPKSPNRPDRWYFCEKHAAEYNAGWNYFEGLDKEESAARESAERSESSGYAEAQHYGWAESGDGTRSRDEIRALDMLGLTPDVDFEAVRRAWRAKAKLVHPDVRPNDAEAAKQFQAIQVAYEVLRAAEDRRQWKGGGG